MLHVLLLKMYTIHDASRLTTVPFPISHFFVITISLYLRPALIFHYYFYFHFGYIFIHLIFTNVDTYNIFLNIFNFFLWFFSCAVDFAIQYQSYNKTQIQKQKILFSILLIRKKYKIVLNIFKVTNFSLFLINKVGFIFCGPRALCPSIS